MKTCTAKYKSTQEEKDSCCVVCKRNRKWSFTECILYALAGIKPHDAKQNTPQFKIVS